MNFLAGKPLICAAIALSVNLQSCQLSFHLYKNLPVYNKTLCSAFYNDYDLNFSELESMSAYLLASFTSLQVICLSNNNSSSLPEDLFSGLANLQAIHLYSNDLSCKPIVPSGVNLYVDDDNLEICGSSS